MPIAAGHSTVALIEGEKEQDDPWDLPELKDTGVKWSGKVSLEEIKMSSTIQFKIT